MKKNGQAKRKPRQSNLKKITFEVDPVLWKWYKKLGEEHPTEAGLPKRTTTWHLREALRLYKKLEMHLPNF